MVDDSVTQLPRWLRIGTGDFVYMGSSQQLKVPITKVLQVLILEKVSST